MPSLLSLFRRLELRHPPKLCTPSQPFTAVSNTKVGKGSKAGPKTQEPIVFGKQAGQAASHGTPLHSVSNKVGAKLTQ